VTTGVVGIVGVDIGLGGGDVVDVVVVLVVVNDPLGAVENIIVCNIKFLNVCL